MNEHKAIARIHDKNRKKDTICRKTIRVHKVLDDFAAGIPDAEYFNKIGINCRRLVIEYKYVKDLPKRDTTIVKPQWNSEQQRIWCDELFGIGENVLVIIAYGSGISAKAVILFNKEEWNFGITTTEARRRSIPLNKVAPIIQSVCTNAATIPSVFEGIEGYK